MSSAGKPGCGEWGGLSHQGEWGGSWRRGTDWPGGDEVEEDPGGGARGVRIKRATALTRMVLLPEKNDFCVTKK